MDEHQRKLSDHLCALALANGIPSVIDFIESVVGEELKDEIAGARRDINKIRLYLEGYANFDVKS